jgi:hypothetical protein
MEQQGVLLDRGTRGLSGDPCTKGIEAIPVDDAAGQGLIREAMPVEILARGGLILAPER